MASALLASRNELCWGERNVYMRNPSNPNPRSDPLSAFDPDRAAQFRSIRCGNDDEMPSTAGVGAGPAAVAASEDSSSLNRRLIGGKTYRNSGGGACVAFRVSSYSKSEQRELRRRLESELEQVRSFSSRIQARDLEFPSRSAVGPLGSETVEDEKVNLGSCRGPKKSKVAVDLSESKNLMGSMMKSCGQILSKLMKQKKSVWFNSPVDVVGMGLHDYFHIVKTPMDLGNVKSKLNKGLYNSPVEFAADMRLTFNNALLYNPQGHEVHKLAGQYLRLFDSLFEPAYSKYQQQLMSIARSEQQVVSREVDGHAKTRHSAPVSDAARRSAPPPRVQTVVPSIKAKSPQRQTSERPPHVQHQHYLTPGKAMPGKQPKPRAKDLDKRPMSYEEKQKLGQALESLPHDKMAQVLQIVSKRNGNPTQNGDDEIELDIEVIDTETLWELDRFVNNCRKTMSKMRRQEEAPIGGGNYEATTAPSVANSDNRSPMQVVTPETIAAKRFKKADIADEDVDIGEEMPPAHYPSLEIEKNVRNASSSSSSGSDSSSDDSGSGSSSGSDSSDAESPAVGLKSSKD